MTYFIAHPQFLFGMPGGTELIFIVLIIILFFGGKKIPGLMRGLGKSVKEFNDAKNAGKKKLNDNEGRGNIEKRHQREAIIDKSPEN